VAIEAPTEPSVNRRHSGGTETILLVEDERAVRLFAQRALEEHGYNVLALGDPGLARDAAIDDPGAFDAVGALFGRSH
jgi:hypothetical protein